MSESTPALNPYIGPAPFQTGQELYGRDDEADELLNLLIAQRLVLFYAPSGAGKTSLVEASLRPRLERAGFWVLATLRVGAETAPPTLRSRNRYAAAMIEGLLRAH